MTQEQKKFIETVGALAAADMQKTGVPASLTIAQAILESGWGKSGLTVRGNALFGIKAGPSWKGRVYSAQTQECYDGVTFTTITALFRAYDSWAESVADHSALLTGLSRYKAVIGERDYKTACRAIKAAGYATDPDYADRLIQIIESYGLTAYDGAAKKGETTVTAKEKQNRENIVAIAQSFCGCKESDGSHRQIIDLYNAHRPLARGYSMKYTDAWCACFVSTVSIQGGATSVMPTEAGCGKMIDLYRKLGRWQESDKFTPAPGDVIFYDWEDGANYAATDNAGNSDHVGIVVSVTGSTIKVIEGNMNNAVGYRNLAVNGRYIRGYGLPDFSAITVKVPAESATGSAGVPAASGSGTTAAKMRIGARMQYSGPVYRDSNGNGQGKTVSGTFTVKYYYAGRKCGVHIDGLGWVPESACSVIG